MASFFRAHAMQPACAFCAALLKACQQLGRWLHDPYRPERHYMRGPGPKYQEKNGHDAGAH
jgi:hypothetical protein